jgi:hypothetical protein
MADQEAPATQATDLDAIEARIDAAVKRRIWNENPRTFDLHEATREAAELRRLVAEVRAARTARAELQALHSDLHDYDLTAASANRLRRILTTWDEQAAEEGGK